MQNNNEITKIDSVEIKEEWKNFDYQKDLTQELDKHRGNFTQETINKIVLWKVGRYAQFDEQAINKINEITGKETEFDADKTREILRLLLDIKGVKLAMASTILRFKNPKIYQIIDQRAYRVIYSQRLNIATNVDKAIDLYFEYLINLRAVCQNKNIPFEQSDRILYNADKDINKDIKLNNY